MFVKMFFPWRTARYKGLSSVDLTRCVLLRYLSHGKQLRGRAGGGGGMSKTIEPVFWMFPSQPVHLQLQTGKQALHVPQPAPLDLLSSISHFLEYSVQPGVKTLKFPSIDTPGAVEILRCSSIVQPVVETLRCSSSHSPGVVYPGVMNCPAIPEEAKVCSSVLKKRRKKMNKHKYRKWRRRTRFIRRALKNG